MPVIFLCTKWNILLRLLVLELRNIVPHYCSEALAAESTSSTGTPIPLLPSLIFILGILTFLVPP